MSKGENSMTATATVNPEPGRLEQLLADLEGKYQKPDPDNIALGAQRFESILHSIIVPFVGFNAFLISGVVLHEQYPNHRLPLFLCNLAGALIVAAWMYFRHSQPQPFPILFYSAVPTFLLAAGLTVPSPKVATPLALLVSYGLGVLVYSSRVPQGAVPIYVIYLPVLLFNLQADRDYRVTTEFLTLIPLGILFIRQRFRMATSAVVFSAVITASYENAEDRGLTALIILLFLLVVLGIWYEIRIPKVDYSPLRAILDQSLLVMLLYAAFYSFASWSSDATTWTWAAAVGAYEAFQSWREKLIYPTRIAVAAIALTIALWASDKPLPASLPIGGSLLIAALMNLAALRLGSSLLSNLSALLLIPGATKIYNLGDGSLSATVIVLGFLTTACALLIARRPALPPLRPWWHGFVRKNHLDWSRNLILMVCGTILKFPLAAFVFNIFRSCFLWLRYFKGKSGQFGLSDIVYAAAHAYGALIWSRQLQLLAASRNASLNTQLTLATSVWVLWGLALFSSGIRYRTVYQRFVGLAFMITPWALYYPSINEESGPAALVSMVVGGGFWVVGVLREFRKVDAPEQEESNEESSTVNCEG
jgi:transposase